MKTIFSLIATSLLMCCVREESPEKTSQDCIDQEGPGFYLSPSNVCTWAPALGIANDGNYWSGRGGQWLKASCLYSIDIILFRNGSNTNGTGKTRFNSFSLTCPPNSEEYNSIIGGWEGAFEWKMDTHDHKTIIFTNGNSDFYEFSHFTHFTLIQPDAGRNPTKFKTTVITPRGAIDMGFVILAGSF